MTPPAVTPEWRRMCECGDTAGSHRVPERGTVRGACTVMDGPEGVKCPCPKFAAAVPGE